MNTEEDINQRVIRFMMITMVMMTLAATMLGHLAAAARNHAVAARPESR